MITLTRMGRKKLGRIRLNITLPPELVEKANAVAAAESKAFSHLLEEALRPLIEKRWVQPAGKGKRGGK